MENDKPLLMTPDGRLIQRDEMPDRSPPRHVTKHLRQWFVLFAAFLTKQALGTHCGLCHATVPTFEAWRHWGECDGQKPTTDTGEAQPVRKTDQGLEWVTGRKVAKIDLGPNGIEWFRQAQDVYGRFLLGIHCDRCTADLAGLNADQDAIYSTACNCREFLGPNREYSPQPPEILH